MKTPQPSFWKNRTVLVTGHSGFKGSWLSLWLTAMGAKVSGLSLSIPTNPSLFDLASVEKRLIRSTFADIRDVSKVQTAVEEAKPEIIFHLAAQSLVRDSYKDPLGTYMTNVIGLGHVLEIARRSDTTQAVINVTSDKCYENREWLWGYRESDPLGGHDPYSSSKACAEIFTSSYRRSFEEYSSGKIGLATVRAGNVIGGGDWAEARLVPDCVRAVLSGEQIIIRNPNSLRPWQHVLEPLCGYLIVAEKLIDDPKRYSEPYNFGPREEDVRPVLGVVEQLCKLFRHHPGVVIDSGKNPHEAGLLKLDSSKAAHVLGWHPVWKLDTALEKIVEWTNCYRSGGNITDLCEKQIADYGTSAAA